MDSTKPVHRSQRVISWLIISLLVWQPVAPAFAAAIAPNGQTTMDKAANGVPVVNIATPNASGISHNQFQDYNVGKEGLILNNATGQLTQTQLGGLIQNNPNLQAGKEARGIINEVVGASRSQLQGYTEVAGKAANVIVANPYGITCNGCGFINTPNATLTTGKPQFDANGNLAALDVTQGSITIEGQGLDASGSDALSLISRATEVNAAIHAKDLTVTVGANRVDASGKATAIASQNPAPTIAVDTGALGGMYANRIHLVSSDKGVGVNLGNLTARQGDITLDASGKLTVKNSLASGSLNARGDGVSLTGEHKAGGTATLTSTQDVALKDATLVADGAVSLNSHGTLSATNSTLTSGKGLTMSASQIGLDGTSRADAAGDVSLSGGDITNQGEVNTSGSLALSASTLDNSGKLAAKGRVDAQASRLSNSGNIQGNGVTVHAGTTQNSGALQSSDALSLTGDALSQSGTLSAGGDMTLSLTGALENGGQGKTLSDGILQIDAGTWTQNGTLSGQQGLTVNAGNLYGGEGSLTSSLGEIHLNATQHAGFDGQVSATGNLTVTADDVATGTRAQLQSSDTLNLQANSATLDGTQAAKNALTVTAKNLSHGGKSSADNITLNAPQTLTNSGKLVANTLSMNGGQITNSGTLVADALTLQGDQITNSGAMGTGTLTVSGTQLTNRGTMQADALTLSGSHITNSGLLQGTNIFGLHTDRLDNLAGGTLYSVHDLTFDIPELNNSGLITTDSHLRLGGRSLMNAGEINGVTFDMGYQSVDNRSTGRLLADEGLTFTADSITNAGLLGAKQLSVTADRLVNQGSVQGNEALTLTTTETTNSGTLRSGGTLTLNGQTLDNSGNLTATSLLLNLTQHAKNSAAGQITATQDATLFTPELLNSGLISASDLALESADITNSGTLQGINALVAKGTQLVNQQGGVVLSNGAVTLTHDRLDNRGQIQGDTLDLATGEWINSGNALGENGITAKVDGNVTNQGKILSQKTLTLTANQSQNSGTLAAKVLALHSDLQNSGILQGSDTLNWDGNTFTSTSNGKVLSGNTLTLQGKEIDNQGQIQSRALTLTADNWQNGGAVQAQDNLSATLTGTLNNKGTLLSQNLSTLSAGTLLNDGKLAAKNLNITAPSLTSNGILQGNESLTLATRNLLNGANGQFISGSALDLNLDRLENQGLLYVNGGFTLKGNTLLNGGNLEADALDLHIDTLLNNPGVLLAHNGATLYGDTIANSGQIAGNTVALTATGITNSGLIQGSQQAQATAQRMTNATAGKWLSGGDFTGNVDVLNNAGTLQGNRIGLTGTTLDNQGVINGLTNLTGVFSGDLINGGQLISAGSTDLRTTLLNNSGRLIGDTLALNAGSLSNSGLWQGTTSLVLQADTLTTDVNSRTLSGGDFTLTAGQLTTQGTLQGGLVNITADDWTHKGSLLSQEGLTADVAGTLTTPGSIMSQKGLAIRAQQTDNSGSILSEGAATLSGQTLNNQGSVQGKSLALHQDSITNNGALTGLDSLTLDAKKTLMARMAMAVPQLTLINGANGQLLTQGTLDVTAGSVTNAGVWQGKNILLAAQSLENSGAIQSADGLNISVSGTLNSTAGSKITAMGSAALDALALTNQGQWAANNLVLNADTLTNGGVTSGVNGLTLTLNGALTQQPTGTLQSSGTLSVAAASVTNQGKVVGGTLAITTGALTNNGRLQSDGDTTLTLSGNLTNNASGEIVSGRGLTVTTPSMLNYGLIQGSGETRLDATTLARNDGKVLSGGRLTLTAPQYTGTGVLQATNLILNAASNTGSGKLVADLMTLTGDTFTNQGTTQAGELVLNYRQLTNNGTLLGTSKLTVNATQVDQSASGKLFSGGDLFVGATGLNALGQMVALGNLTLQLANAFTAQTTLAAGQTLSITSNGAITNQSVMQGQAVNLTAGGQLTNNGQITTGSGSSTLSGSQVVLNTGSSIQGGGDVTLASRGNITANGFVGTLGNLTLSAPGSLINTALLYAANNMSLYANSITNQRGNILAGNNLWMQRDAAGNANSDVTNTSGTIETRNGDITIKTGRLLNQREGVSAQTTTVQITNPAYVGNASFSLSLSEMSPQSYEKVLTRTQVNVGSCNSIPGYHGACTMDEPFFTTSYKLTDSGKTKRFATEQIISSVTSNTALARIASGKNIVVQADKLDNDASAVLANQNIALSGGVLNNNSYQAGKITTYLTYKATGINANGASYVLSDRTQEYEDSGSMARAVIQAGGTVTANFSSNISNTNTTANAGGVSSTITAPSLNTLSNQSIGGSVQKEALTNAGPVAVNSPQWQDQLQGALQQINGGGALDNSGASGTSLTNVSSQQKGNASLGNAPSLVNAGATNAVLTSTNNGALGHYTGKTVDTSAYPLPTGNDGYFVVTDNPKSPYLITINPKLDGLGQLDPALFGDLNKLLGINPSAAPRETNTAYTDEKQFLGSSYMLSRINLNPDYDYRFLGDAAFDTRYVSNVILNQTGNRYLNGVGSDLAQMQYLMDNAASAQQSLGLQFGVSLTADQIAALNHSILWWESATINGETVMVPKVYLSPNDVTVNNGSVIAGNNVNLSSGSITNGGSTLLAKNDLSVNSAGQINNTGDALIKAGGNLSLSAIGDINNLSSTISGKTVQLESLDGSINNITLADQYSLNAKDKYGSVNIKGTTLGSTASISAQDSLSLEAWNDINLVGAKLASGGDMLLDAWGDVNVKAIQVSDNYNQSGFFGNKATSDTSTTWQKSGISAGGNLNVQAANDLTLTASDISAGKDAALVAGNNLNLNAEQTEQSSLKGKSETHATGQDRTTVSAGGDLKLTAGQDVTSQAAALAAEEKVTIQAGRDVNLQAEATTEGDSYKSSKKTVINEAVRQQGTEIASGTDTVIVAGRDVNTQAAQVTAQGDIGVTAGRDVNLNTATESDYAYKEKTVTSGGFLSKSTTHTVSEQSATHEAGTLLSGDNVTVKAGNDLLVKGSSVVGDGDVALNAGHNLDITAATNTDSNWQLKEKKKSGLMGSGGIGFTIGSSKSKQELKEKGTTQSQSVSTVGSNGGDVTITAGNQLHVGGSDLIAKNDLALTGDSVVIDPGHDKRTTDQKFEQKSSGLTVALTGAVVDAVNSAVTTAQAASKQSDSRLAALQATKSVLSGYQAMQGKEMADTTGEPDSGIRISVSLTTQKSKSEQHQKSDQVSGSTLNAGNDLSITATGKNHEANSGDIVVAGSSMKAGGDASLDAARDIVLAGAANTQKTTGSNSSSGGGVGVSFGVSQGGAGLSVFANVNAAKGNEKGDGTDWTETTLDSGGKVSLHSGQDATLTGAQVSGNQVTADIGRNLTVTSLQDSNNYDSKQSSISAGGSFTFGSMTGSGYINFSQDKMHSTFDSVAEQSGIFAGEGGFDVTVGSHTQLNGGAIGSTATADKNSLDTGTLGYSNITNKADYKVSHSGGGFSSSATMGAQAALSAASTLMSSVGSSGHAKGTTEAAVSEGTIIVRDTANQQQDVSGLQRDVSQANDAISPIFNKEKEQNRLQAVQMISDIGNQVSDIVRTNGELAKAKAQKDPEALKAAKETLAGLGKLNPTDKEIVDQAGKTVEAQYGTGSALQRGITAATAAIGALAGGDIKSALAGAAAPELAYLIGQNVKDDAAKVIAHAVVNAALAAATNKNVTAAAASAATGEIVGKLALELYAKQATDLNEEQKQTVSALATLASGLAGGMIADSTAGAVAGAQSGKTTVENNLLGGTELGPHQEAVQQHGKDVLSCVENEGGAACQRGQAVNKAIALALGGGATGVAVMAATPAIIASAQAAALTCSSNPVLCANQVSIWAAEMGMGDALPAGLGISLAAGKTASPETLDKLAQLSAMMSIEKQTGQKATKEAISTIVANSVEHTPLPVGYLEGGSVGAKFNSAGGLPEGYRRVVNSKTGITEILGTDGKLYLETSTGLVPKQGGNLAQLSEAEKNIANQAGAESKTGALYGNTTQVVSGRIDELKNAIPVNSQGRITMAVAVVEDSAGNRTVLVSTSEPRGYLRPGVTLNPSETMVTGTGHAESDIVNYAKENGLKVIDIGATRPVCSSCQQAISTTDSNISTPLKPPRKGQ